MGFALKLSPWFRAMRLPRFDGSKPKRFGLSERASAAVEFAIVGPVLILLMMGIFTYGGYFLTAHTVQQIANDAARAAIAGLDDEERLSLARQATQAGLRDQTYMRGAVSDVALSRIESSLSIRVTYDASEDIYWAFQALLPVPSPAISRTATIRMGGL